MEILSFFFPLNDSVIYTEGINKQVKKKNSLIWFLCLITYQLLLPKRFFQKEGRNGTI